MSLAAGSLEPFSQPLGRPRRHFEPRCCLVAIYPMASAGVVHREAPLQERPPIADDTTRTLPHYFLSKQAEHQRVKYVFAPEIDNASLSTTDQPTDQPTYQRQFSMIFIFYSSPNCSTKALLRKPNLPPIIQHSTSR
jgi:hypothetical protein